MRGQGDFCIESRRKAIVLHCYYLRSLPGEKDFFRKEALKRVSFTHRAVEEEGHWHRFGVGDGAKYNPSSITDKCCFGNCRRLFAFPADS